MGITLAIIGGILLLLLIFGIVSYNRFISQRQLIKDAWANIDTELRRRYDLIPNLVETVRGYASHERAVFENVTKARAAATAATGSPAEQAAAEGPLVAALRQLLAVAEAYPDLKANQNMMQLSEELTSTENKVAFARQAFNDAVMNYNNAREMFPNSIVAGMFMFLTVVAVLGLIVTAGAWLLPVGGQEELAPGEVPFTKSVEVIRSVCRGGTSYHIVPPERVASVGPVSDTSNDAIFRDAAANEQQRRQSL